jgi:flagellar basal body-associated protein FliL
MDTIIVLCFVLLLVVGFGAYFMFFDKQSQKQE